MTSTPATTTAPAPAAPPAGQQPDTGEADEQRDPWGRALDAAGIIAAGVLVLILADVFTGGRVLSRFFRRADESGDPAAVAEQPPPPAS